jgi:hypothetical protein
MCDYSLHLVASRPAKVGDKLVSARFPSSTTRGFASPTEPDTAVCLLPGTEIAFERDAECESALTQFKRHNIGQKVARFRQVNTDNQMAHHDALEFPDGQIVLVTDLVDGQHVAVLQLPAPTGKPEHEDHEAARADDLSDASA